MFSTVRIWLVTVLLLVSAQLPAQDTGWEITSFDVAYQVNRDRTIDVVERLSVDFGPLQKHGIYREIPVVYQRIARAGVAVPAGEVEFDLELKGVTNESGVRYQVDVTRGDRVRLRIGDPDLLVSGRQVYVIQYTLASGLGFFDDHDELYWQVTGTEWPVPILTATARVTIPAVDSITGERTAWCYAGWYDSSSNERCTAEVSAPHEFRFATARLEPGEGLTLVAGFPKGLVPEPTAAELRAAQFGIWWPSSLPVFMLVGMFFYWRTHGREPRAGSIVPQWKAPENLRPGAAGTLIDQHTNMNDVVATLLDLAVRGYIVIREVPPEGLLGEVKEGSLAKKLLKSLGLAKNDWEVTRTAKPADDLSGYERKVLHGLLEGSDTRLMSDLHHDFYKHLPKIYDSLYAEVVSQGYFLKRPDKVRLRYLLIGVGIMMLAPLLGGMATNVVLAFALALAGVIMVIFAGTMPVMTQKGAQRWAELKGIEEYIRRAEKSEMEMSQAPKLNVELFSQLLPYAIALKVTDIWVKQFSHVLASTPPTWYVGANMHHFNANQFTSSLNDFQTAATRTMGSSPGSSSGGGGGGSVGGGGGGGGGGSW
jgi:hypothetical protein